jgi:glucose-6-phosphate isomerase
MTSPVDATTTAAWADLQTLKDALVPDLRAWFAADPRRAEEFTFDLADLRVDLSKNLLTDDVVAALLRLADQVDLPGRRAAMFGGEHINVTEDRAVLHTALRLPRDAELVVDGQDVVADVHEVLDKMYAFADKVRSGEWVGVTGKRIETVVNIGIGGSDLGPVMVYEALIPYVQDGLTCRFVSNRSPPSTRRRRCSSSPPRRSPRSRP